MAPPPSKQLSCVCSVAWHAGNGVVDFDRLDSVSSFEPNGTPEQVPANPSKRPVVYWLVSIVVRSSHFAFQRSPLHQAAVRSSGARIR